MKNKKFLDLVVGGPDMSGTSTQIQDTIEFFMKKGKIVKDLRGTENDVLFHSEVFQEELLRTGWGNNFLNFNEFLNIADKVQRTGASTIGPRDFLFYANNLLSGGETNQDLRVASMVKNNITTYINPNSADVWVIEEPSKRGAGQVNRVIEQNRSKFKDTMNPKAAAESHSIYRNDEALRFRIPLRENNKIIIRSRSEESGTYQIYDKESLKNGVKKDYYFQLEGHKVAFQNPPTNIFVVCGPENWTKKDYLELKKERSNGRSTDDHERNASYQVLVNKRYSTDWLENFYKEGCKMHGGTIPEITRFSIYASKEEIKKQMQSKLEKLI
jgi:thymidylate kinase